MGTTAYSGKIAIITGGASGIGAAIAKAIVREGGDVVIADRQVEAAEGIASELRGQGGRATAEDLDVRSLPAMVRVVERTVARSGRIDYFFNNAGIGVGGEADAYEPRDWDDVIDVNLRGVTNGIQAVYSVMIGQKTGHIVNTASLAGLIPTPGTIAYTATKHAVVGLSKGLRIEAKRHGVRVSVLCPGVIRTPILTGGKYGRTNVVGLSDEKALAQWEKARPLDVDVFARQAIRAVARNEAIIVLPRWWRTFWYIDRFSPSLGMKVAEWLFNRARAELEQAGARPARDAALKATKAAEPANPPVAP
jgi:NAD(P)-dependent dehydrogenase (short-subunit alcohol dehydrogenase family)